MPEENNKQPPTEFKPNIYPIMYWALAFGIVAGLLLFILRLLAQFITVIWFPVFLIGLIWGAYRNYKKQKREWVKYSGMPIAPASPLQEFKQAARDIMDATRDMVAQNAIEDAERAIQAEQTFTQEEVMNEEPIGAAQGKPPVPPPPIPPRIV